MSKLGKEIKVFKTKLNKNIKSLDKWNLLEQDIIKIYIHYLKEIINDNEEANIYIKKISEELHDKHQYDEINLYHLNFEELSKNEDYKYIIINLTKNNYYKITNISFSVCKLFGYSKEELIGNTFDILCPELFKNNIKIFFSKKN